jgi:uncharacterized protein
MKTDLDHLPERKQRYVNAISDLIVNNVCQLTEYATGKKKLSKITHIILFGSYAKGEFTDDPEHGYTSDYDILVVLNNEFLIEEYGLWNNIQDKAERRVHSPVSLIVHTSSEVSKWLEEGQYFFSDIQQEGIYLYCSTGKPLPEPKKLTNEERRPIAESHYKQWFESANKFYRIYEFCRTDNDLNISAFQLHQSTERYYNAVLLVLSNYRPKTHDLKQLQSMAIEYAKEIETIFPQDTRFKRRSLERLKRAYVEARYSEHYVITGEELDWLADQVSGLKSLVEATCKTHIDSL